LIIYSSSSTNPENLANIGSVGVEIIGLTEIVKNVKQRQNSKPAVGCFSTAGDQRGLLRVRSSLLCIRAAFSRRQFGFSLIK